MADDAKAKGKPAPQMADPNALRAGPKPEREAELVAKWNAEHSATG